MIPEHCPKCGVDFKGRAVPEKDRESFGGATNFSRVVGLYDSNLDRTTEWLCPDCGHVWPLAERRGT